MEFPDMPDPGENLSSPLSEVISARDKATLDMVREALLKKRVLLAYQPVMQTARPDQVAFYEGFIRVADRKGRIIPARDFMGVVEKQEMGRILDTLALEKGLEALEIEPGLRLSINMSARSIGYPRWNRVMEAGLIKDPTIAERLILEITESSAITLPEIVQVFMADMQMKGISFALDNFGAGYT
ncbi:MAG TPA: EAL domain-containing protein, partial [Rhodobacteraceae bacterium]|nr:EAL domain-containing protein [Paracoccaceae bacterium]